MFTTKQVREIFKGKFANGHTEGGTVEMIGLNMLADAPYIFREPNQSYIDAEIEWYESQSRSVDDLAKIYGRRVGIWDSVASKDGLINSNYGWCIYSEENGNQFMNVVYTLSTDPNSRQAVMVYNRPEMHNDATENGRRDFMCTHSVHYMIRNGKLISLVNMRSNDLVFGYNNDYAWQKHVQTKLATLLEVKVGEMIWNVGNAHVYERHFNLLGDTNG